MLIIHDDQRLIVEITSHKHICDIYDADNTYDDECGNQTELMIYPTIGSSCTPPSHVFYIYSHHHRYHKYVYD